MYTIRCTQKVLARLNLSASELPEAPPPTTALGDWYAHLFLIQRQPLILCVSANARLCVLTPARDMEHLPQRLYYSLVELLRALDLPEEAIARERREMIVQCGYGPTTRTKEGRSVLGSMNDFSNALRNGDLHERSLDEWNLYFSRWICGPLGPERPRDAAARLLTKAFVEDAAPVA